MLGVRVEQFRCESLAEAVLKTGDTTNKSEEEEEEEVG